MFASVYFIAVERVVATRRASVYEADRSCSIGLLSVAISYTAGVLFVAAMVVGYTLFADIGRLEIP